MVMVNNMDMEKVMVTDGVMVNNIDTKKDKDTGMDTEKGMDLQVVVIATNIIIEEVIEVISFIKNSVLPLNEINLIQLYKSFSCLKFFILIYTLNKILFDYIIGLCYQTNLN